MRGIYTPVTKIRRQVFSEIAKLGYKGSQDFSELEDLPYKIIPGQTPTYRDSIFVERAIVGERLRLAMGFDLRNMEEHAALADGIDQNTIDWKEFDLPLVNVIPFACNACEETSFFVTNECQGCLAHPCVSVCPVSAVTFQNGQSFIDKEKCIKCGRCAEVCPYSAIVKRKRPCAESCGVDAIESDEYGRATINYEKCVSCGQCLVHCPFAAIADKSQIFQLTRALAKKEREVIAIMAPSFVGQFGPLATPGKVKSALKELGLSDVYEVALGADLCAINEAEEFLHEVPEHISFMGTSCCPAWAMLAKTQFPELTNHISMTLTPMVLTARIVKREHPNAQVVFIGPCAAKKLEAHRKTVRSDVDYVITFEELMGMFAAKDIDFTTLPEEPIERAVKATAQGRGFAVGGGVAGAVLNVVKEKKPELEVQVDYAEGLRDCKKLLTLAKVGKRDGYLLEGMACPGGCVAGAGTLQPIKKASASVKNFSSKAAPNATENDYAKLGIKE